MWEISAIKLNNKEEHIFDYSVYIYDCGEGDYTFYLEIVVSEIVAKKYSGKKHIDVTLLFKDKEYRQLTMDIEAITEVGNAEVPVIELAKGHVNLDEYNDIEVFTVDNFEPRNLDSKFTIQEIRRVEMPFSEVDTILRLPIDQVEWIDWTKEGINEMISEAIYDYWEKKNIKN